jgi:hypothetical protein
MLPIVKVLLLMQRLLTLTLMLMMLVLLRPLQSLKAGPSPRGRAGSPTAKTRARLGAAPSLPRRAARARA